MFQSIYVILKQHIISQGKAGNSLVWGYTPPRLVKNQTISLFFEGFPYHTLLENQLHGAEQTNLWLWKYQLKLKEYE